MSMIMAESFLIYIFYPHHSWSFFLWIRFFQKVMLKFGSHSLGEVWGLKMFNCDLNVPRMHLYSNCTVWRLNNTALYCIIGCLCREGYISDKYKNSGWSYSEYLMDSSDEEIVTSHKGWFTLTSLFLWLKLLWIELLDCYNIDMSES